MAAFDDQERTELAATVDRLLTDIAPPTRVREVAESDAALDQPAWEGLAELGALGVLVPAEHGGLGGSLADAAVVLDRLGARLTVVPFVSSAVLATTLLAADPTSPLARHWLPLLASGEARACVALGAPPLRWSTPGRSQSGGLSGGLGLVLDVVGSDLLLAPAVDPDGRPAWFGLPTGGVAVESVALHDPTRRAARVRVDGTGDGAQLHVAGGDADAFGALLHDVAGCALAADSVGSAQRALDLTVEYVRTREQFGHPIGTFQAVKHRCTDMFVDVVAARAAVAEALDAAEVGDSAGHEGRGILADVAKNQATRRHVRVAGAAVQLHGGIGFTWEHDLHLHLKRGLLNRALYGSEVQRGRAIWEHITA